MKELNIIQNADGVFEEYDDTYDITIHCTSQEEQDNVLEKLNREECADAISRQAVLEAIDAKAWEFCDYLISKGRNDEQKPVSHFADNLRECISKDLPPVTPQYTEAEIQKMQDLEFAEIQKAYEIGKAENPNKWIPVSERLPEPNQTDGLTARYYLVQNEYEDMLVARYDGKGWEQIYQHEYLEDEVSAWMPLPEPYKASPTGAESEDKE